MKCLVLVFFGLFVNACFALEPPSRPHQFKHIDGRYVRGYHISYYCHFGAVYMVYTGEKDEPISTNVLWNVDTGKPYRCEAFSAEREQLMKEYQSQLDAYHKENPPPDVKPNRHTRP